MRELRSIDPFVLQQKQAGSEKCISTSTWTLQGYASRHCNRDIDRVRSLVPEELEIISCGLVRTLGGVYLSHYGSGSVLEYSELIVIAALVGYRGKFGGWVSHMWTIQTQWLVAEKSGDYQGTG